MLNIIDYKKVGKRIRQAREATDLTQEQIGEILECGNTYISHVESGQTKASLPLLLNLSVILDRDIHYFLMDTPFVTEEDIVQYALSDKLQSCNEKTLRIVEKLLDVLIEEQGPSKAKSEIHERMQYYQEIAQKKPKRKSSRKQK